MMRRVMFFILAVLLLLPALLSACTSQEFSGPIDKIEVPVDPYVAPISEARLDAVDERSYLSEVSFAPEDAQYFDLVNDALPLTDAEVQMLANNGFVVSDRLTWNRFIEAYAWIYWQDLPVLITTDSILHALHQSYSDLLERLEHSILLPELEKFLNATEQQVLADRQANQNQELATLYEDLEIYLAVARALVRGEEGEWPAVQQYVTLAVSADSISEIKLFGSKRDIDFTLFKPRAHYVNTDELQQYFRAMSWLAQIDLRWLEFDPLTSEPILNMEQMAATALLQNGIDRAEQRERWKQINQLFEILVGRSDNMTLPDFDRFLTDANLADPADMLRADREQILTLLSQNEYGQQRITGQIVKRHINNDSTEPIGRPISFMLFGQRFGIDSYVMANLVYDRLLVDGQPIERPLPAPLDLMYVLGNDHAVSHLTDELETYHYGGHLAALRERVDDLEPSFWQAPIYNQWLGLIRTLNGPTLSEDHPQAMRTAAWADKMLQTQLASWAQLRHDNILIIKQSFTTAQIMCEYPSGYVEPYPAFYGALRDFASAGHRAVTQLDGDELNGFILEEALVYFESVRMVAERLQTLAEKELRLEEFTSEEEAFVKSVIVRQADADFQGCGGPTFEDLWDGWYQDLFYDKDDNPAVIADVHTNPTNDPLSALYPPRVLHAATGPVAPLFFIVDTDEGPTLYVGPAFTYFEVLEEGNKSTPPSRLTDDDWRKRLNSSPYPASPPWTSRFRLPITSPPERLLLPNNEE